MPNPFNENVERPDFRCIYEGKITQKSSFYIYPFHQLALLINEMRQFSPPSYTLLFLVDDAGQMWFASKNASSAGEGSQYSIPLHYQMTGKPAQLAYCMTAGVLELSPDYITVINLSNRSCSFKPTFDSLKWALAIMTLNKARLEELSISLSSELVLDEYSSYGGGYQGMSYTLNTEEFAGWVSDTFKDEAPYLIQKEHLIKEVVYQPSLVGNRNSTFNSIKVGEDGSEEKKVDYSCDF